MRVSGRGGWFPPSAPAPARAIRLFDRSDFTRFTPTQSAYRLHSGVERRLECLSLPWMPGISDQSIAGVMTAPRTPWSTQFFLISGKPGGASGLQKGVDTATIARVTTVNLAMPAPSGFCTDLRWKGAPSPMPQARVRCSPG